MTTRIGVGLSGALALCAVANAASYYAGVDRFAFSIVMVMAAVVCAGIVELFRVCFRTARLRAQLAGIASAPSEAPLDRASPLLRALLSARLDRSALPVPGPVFAPYLLSLLVMLGLLGTFLGLFETLRGASIALDASADVDALRGGLKAPIGGLMRAFGTSAAGVASSAMLGLATVLVRRDGTRLAVELHAVASGALSHLAPAHRQLVALEALAEQGRALPQAAAALADAAAKLQALEASWRQTHAEVAEAQRAQLAGATASLSNALEQGLLRHAAAASDTQASLQQATGEIRDAIQAAVGRAAEASREAVSPLLARAASEQAAVVREHLDAVRAHVQEAGTELTRELSDAAQAVRAHVQEAGTALTRELSGTAEAVRAHVQEAGTELTRELSGAAQAVRAQLERGSEADLRREAQSEALLERLGAASESIGQAAKEQTGALADFVRASDERQRLAEAQREQHLAQLLEGWQGHASAQAARLDGFAQHADARDTDASRARAQQLEQLLSAWHELAHAQATRLGELEARLVERQAEHAEALTSRLHAHIGALQGPLERAAALLDEASQRVQGGGMELQAVAESFAKAVAAQREGARQWLESLGDIERYALEAGEAAAAEALDQHLARTHEVFDRQLKFQEAVLEQLHGLGVRQSQSAARADASA